MQSASLAHNPSGQAIHQKDGDPPNATNLVKKTSRGRYVNVVLNLTASEFIVSYDDISYLRKKYPSENFPTNRNEYSKKKWRTNECFISAVNDNPCYLNCTLHKFQTASRIPARFYINDCWGIERFTCLDVRNCVLPDCGLFEHANPKRLWYYEKFEFDINTAKYLHLIKYVNRFQERFACVLQHLDKEQDPENKIKKLMSYFQKESKLDECCCEISEFFLPEEDQVKIILGYTMKFNVSEDDMVFLKETYPEENFPDNQEDYKGISLRTNKKLVSEVQETINTGRLRYTYKYLKCIPRKMLDYPEAINILMCEKSGSFPYAENVLLYKNKLDTKIALQYKKKLLNEITALFIKTLDNRNGSAEERLNHFYSIIPGESPSEQTEPDHLQPCKNNETGKENEDNCALTEYLKGLKINYDYAPRYGIKFQEAKNHFNKCILKTDQAQPQDE